MSFSLNCANPVYVKKTGILVPCGKCLKCRSKYRLQWQLRLQHELDSYNGVAMFLTLTYDDENLPDNYTLVKKDVQLFLKRLRKYYSDIKIKYFAVGEYGTKKFRPHYHLIIYGIKAPEQKKKSVLNFKYGLFLAERIWKKGFCFVGYVDAKCINYVSKYVMKEFIKEYSKEDLINAGLLPPFSLKSTGLGLHYLLNHLEYIKGQISAGRTIKLYKSRIGYPRYYRKKLVELGHFPEDYFLNKYYEEMDKLQSSVISEMESHKIKLDPVNSYFNISLSHFFDLDNMRSYCIKSDTFTINNKEIHFDYTDTEPISIEFREDVLKNHWFVKYLDFCKAKGDLQLKRFLLSNKDYEDIYE